MEFGIETVIIALAGILVALVFIVRYYRLKVTINEKMVDPVVLRITIPKDNDKSPQAAEQMYASIYGIMRGKQKSLHHFSLEIVAGGYGIFFLAVINKRYQQFLENQIYAQYPNAQIKEIKDYSGVLLNSTKQTASVEIGLAKDYFLPIKTFVSFEVDPLAAITSAISKLEGDQELFIQFVVRPIDNSWQKIGRDFVNSRKSKKDSEGKKVELGSGESDELREIERKSSKLGFQFLIRVIALAGDSLTAEHMLEDVEASFKQFESGQFNSLSVSKASASSFSDTIFGKRQNQTLPIAQKYIYRFLDERSRDIINIEELASLFHLPNTNVEVAKIAWSRSKKLPYPMNLPGRADDVRVIGLTDYRNLHFPFGVKSSDRRRHMYILGKTGTGKSTMLKNLIMGDIYAGKGVGVLDPHGDLIDDILSLIPANRVQDVVLLDPSDVEFPIGLNILKLKEGEEKDIVADGIVEIFKKFFGDSWGPRLQYILNNAILTLLQVQNVSLLGVTRLLEDRNYRKFIIKQLDDPILKKYWDGEYAEMVKNPKLLTESLSSIQNKVGRFVTANIIRNIVGQIKSTIDLEEIMNTRKIFLVNLSQGKIGEENSALLGGMLITRLYTNAMQRVKIPEKDRVDFYLYVDEFQNFATTTFVKILSEARKYGLNLVVAHQYIDQLLPEVRDAIFGNVGTMMNFVVGPKDASVLEREYKPHLTGEDLVNLEKYRFVNKITIDGSQTAPFTAISLPPTWVEQGAKQQIINHSRTKYAVPRDIIESKINKWAGSIYNESGNLVQTSAGGSQQGNSVDQGQINPQQGQANPQQRHSGSTQGQANSTQWKKPQPGKATSQPKQPTSPNAQSAVKPSTPPPVQQPPSQPSAPPPVQQPSSQPSAQPPMREA